MDLKKLNAIDVNNPAQVKELQQFLKTRGYYSGPIDGKWGGKTTDGTVALRNDLTEEGRTARDTALANERANDPANKAINMALELGPYAAGAAGGAVAGHFGKKSFDKLDERQASETKRIAGNPKISGPIAEQQLEQGKRARRFRTGGQFLVPSILLGSAEFMRSHVAPKFDEETRKWINLGANADQGAGLGLLAHQVFDLKNRIGSPNDAEDEALIRSRARPAPPANSLAAAGQAKELPAPANSPTSGAPLRANAERLIAAAKAAGATGKLTKASAAQYLLKNVTDANRAVVAAELGASAGQSVASVVKRLASKSGRSSWLLPIAAGAYAASEAGNEARAEGASAGEATGRSAVAGLAAGGLTAGGMYAMNKLAAASPALGPVMAPISVMTGPDFTPESEEYARNRTVRRLPFTRHLSQSHADAYEKAQVPERSPANSGPRNPMALAGEQPDAFGTALNDFLSFVQEMEAQP